MHILIILSDDDILKCDKRFVDFIILGRQKIKRRGGGKSPQGIVANVLDSDIIVGKFKLKLRYYVHFQTNTLAKGMTAVISFPPAMG